MDKKQPKTKSENRVWQWLKQHRFVLNVLAIGIILLGMALLAHFAMHVFTRHNARRVVPQFTGVKIEEAVRMAKENDLEIIVSDSLYVVAYEGGVVLDQLPADGVEVKPGRKVYLTINSRAEKMVPLPYVAGRSLRQAKNMLEIAGLEISELIYRSDMATNYILEQRYNGNLINKNSKIMAKAGSGVTLYVGVAGGYGVAVIPKLAGLTLREAKGRIWESGFNVGEIKFDKGINLLNQKDARVYKQEPAVSRSYQLGTKINIYLSLDNKLTKNAAAEAEKIARAAADSLKEREQALADSINMAKIEQAAREDAEDNGLAEEESDEEGFFE